MDQNQNPFPVISYQGSENFCDREEETVRLVEAIRNGRNTTLTALRRMGKTGLIQLFTLIYILLNRKQTSFVI